MFFSGLTLGILVGVIVTYVWILLQAERSDPGGQKVAGGKLIIFQAPPHVFSRLIELQNIDRPITQREVFVRSLALYEFLMKKRRGGMTFWMKYADGTQVQFWIDPP